jgi:exopolysaccharide biosynthesis polyprenyl glycosylphosphotransferase
MGQSITNRLWDTSPKDSPSQFTRMILGKSVTPQPPVSQKAGAAETAPAPAANAIDETAPKHIRSRAAVQQLPALSAIDTFTLSQLLAADLIVLVMTCGAISLVARSWELPWSYLPIFAVLVMLFGFGQGIYKCAGDPYPAGTVVALALSTALASGLVFVSSWGGMRLLTASGIFVSSFAALVLSRWLRRLVWKQRRRDTESRKILIIGGGAVARSIARALRNDPQQRATVCGFVDDELPLSPAVLGRIDDLDWIARAEFVDEVILALPGQAAQTRKAAETALRNHLDIRAVPDLPPGPWLDSGIDHIGEVPVVTLHHEPSPSAALFLKRLLDIVGATFGLVVASPLLAITALLIRLDSPGPIVYAAERTGAKGRRFRCYKFRSMVTDAEHLKEDLRARNQREGPTFKIDNDPRITRVGGIIRRYSLDELPQLWNVLRGEMSLVGPRPHPIDEVNHYELHQFRRLDVKPGITGLWQITARGCPSFELNMHLDLTYIENWSLRLDLRILAGTVRVLFAPEGA